MAADLAPATYPPWILEKQTKTVGESLPCIPSSEVFFDPGDKYPVQHFTMPEVSSTLTEPFNDQIEHFLDQEYQSSEEALSPTLEDMGLSEEEQEMEDAVAEDGLWNDIKCFDLDYAIAICIFAVGQPKMVNLGQYSSPQIRPNRPERVSSLPPTLPARSRDRVPSMRVRTQFSNESLRHYTFSSSSSEESIESSDVSFEGFSADSTEEPPVVSLEPVSVTPPARLPVDSPMDDGYVAEERKSSNYSIKLPDSSIAQTAPPSVESKEKEPVEQPYITPSFLQTDPFETRSISGKSTSSKSSHSRFRSISNKLSLFGLNKQDAKSDEPKKNAKKERRNSLFRPITPQSTGLKSNDESRNNSQPESPQAALAAPQQPSPRGSTTSKKRMIARGADERQPTISIPPCPDTYDGTEAPVQRLRSPTSARRKRKGDDDLKHRKSVLSMVPH